MTLRVMPLLALTMVDAEGGKQAVWWHTLAALLAWLADLNPDQQQWWAGSADNVGGLDSDHD